MMLDLNTAQERLYLCEMKLLSLCSLTALAGAHRTFWLLLERFPSATARQSRQNRGAVAYRYHLSPLTES